MANHDRAQAPPERVRPGSTGPPGQGLGDEVILACQGNGFPMPVVRDLQ